MTGDRPILNECNRLFASTNMAVGCDTYGTATTCPACFGSPLLQCAYEALPLLPLGCRQGVSCDSSCVRTFRMRHGKRQSHDASRIRISVRCEREWDNSIPVQFFDWCVGYRLPSVFRVHSHRSLGEHGARPIWQVPVCLWSGKLFDGSIFYRCEDWGTHTDQWFHASPSGISGLHSINGPHGQLSLHRYFRWGLGIYPESCERRLEFRSGIAFFGWQRSPRIGSRPLWQVPLRHQQQPDL